MTSELISTGISLHQYLGVATFLFGIGFAGVVSSRHLIRTLMCLELMLNAVNLVFVSINNSINPSDVSGQIFAIFILTISAAEAAVGLAIVLALFKNTASVDVETFKQLHG
ncbi:MAG: NADH-quinone oxidoreductase subunit NuoK [Vampirovibrio sp.]|jgi:NAD(P)H-quinone oxidoreductase subunit 4L